MAVLLTVLLVLEHALLDELHRLEDALVAFFRREHLERLLLGNLDVHAHTVGVTASLRKQLLRGAGNAFEMDVAVEAVDEPQVAHDGREPLHRVVRVAHHPTRQKQSLDVITAVELHRDLLQLADT